MKFKIIAIDIRYNCILEGLNENNGVIFGFNNAFYRFPKAITTSDQIKKKYRKKYQTVLYNFVIEDELINMARVDDIETKNLASALIEKRIKEELIKTLKNYKNKKG